MNSLKKLHKMKVTINVEFLKFRALGNMSAVMELVSITS
jgi:hypothetical protein